MTPYRKFSCVVLVLTSAMSTHAQESSTTSPGTGDAIKQLQDQTALLTAQTALIAAQKANLGAQADLETQKNAAASAAAAVQTAKETARVNAVTTLAGAADKLPSGTQTVASDFKATPASTRVSMDALAATCGELADRIGPALRDRVVVFVDTIPGSVDTYAYQYFLMSAADREAVVKNLAESAARRNRPDRLGLSERVLNRLGAGGLVTTKMAVAAAAGLIAALPGAVGTLLGFFRSDSTEHAGTASNADNTAAALFAKEAGLKRVYPSVEAAAYAQFTGFDALKSVRAAERLLALDAALGDAIDEIGTYLKGPQGTLATFKAEGTELANATAAVKAKLAGVGASLASATDPQAKAALQAQGTDLEHQLAANLRQSKIVAKQTAEAQDVVDGATAWQGKFTLQRAALETLINSLGATGADGVPKLVALIKAELQQNLCFPGDRGAMADRAEASALRLVSLKIVQQPQSTVQKTFAFWKSYYANALVSIEYRVANPDGRIFAEGVLTRSSSEKLRFPERVK